MAKASSSNKGEKYPYPSGYGSHKSMVDEEATKKLNQSGRVVCKDFGGHYITDSKRLDDGMADPNRNASEEWRSEQLTKSGLNDLVPASAAA